MNCAVPGAHPWVECWTFVSLLPAFGPLNKCSTAVGLHSNMCFNNSFTTTTVTPNLPRLLYQAMDCLHAHLHSSWLGFPPRKGMPPNFSKRWSSSSESSGGGLGTWDGRGVSSGGRGSWEVGRPEGPEPSSGGGASLRGNRDVHC